MLNFKKKKKKNTAKYHYFTPVYQNFWWYDLQFLIFRAWQTEIVTFRSFFALLPPSKTPDNQNFEKMEKNCWRYYFTRVPKITNIWCTAPEIQSETCDFLSFWVVFRPFTPLTIHKIKIKKKQLEILSFYKCVP